MVLLQVVQVVLNLALQVLVPVPVQKVQAPVPVQKVQALQAVPNLAQALAQKAQVLHLALVLNLALAQARKVQVLQAVPSLVHQVPVQKVQALQAVPNLAQALAQKAQVLHQVLSQVLHQVLSLRAPVVPVQKAQALVLNLVLVWRQYQEHYI